MVLKGAEKVKTKKNTGDSRQKTGERQRQEEWNGGRIEEPEVRDQSRGASEVSRLRLWLPTSLVLRRKNPPGQGRPRLDRFHIQQGKQESAPFALGYGGPR